MPNYNWSELNHLQLGKYGEYIAKMEFTKAEFDVYTAEVDDKGIDFIIRKNKNEYYDLQVKSIRNYNYVYMSKKKFKPRKNLYLVLVLFEAGKEPVLLLIPSLDWKRKKHDFLIEKNYENKKSKPEWGINISKSKQESLHLFKSEYDFHKQIEVF